MTDVGGRTRVGRLATEDRIAAIIDELVPAPRARGLQREVGRAQRTVELVDVTRGTLASDRDRAQKLRLEVAPIRGALLELARRLG